MPKYIPLTKGQLAIVDDADYESLSKLKWQCTSDNRAIHSYKSNGKVRQIHMSRLLMECPRDKVVDHINRNTLDNRRCNLRVCSRIQNNRNRVLRVKKSSPYIGVHLRVSRPNTAKPWCAYIWNGKHQFIGYFATAKQAAKARDARAKELFGEFAQLNFAA